MSEPNESAPIADNNITDERAARRFHQMATIERQIGVKSLEIANCKSHLVDLKEEADGLVHRLRAAARDEGDLPLFDLDGQ
jgi:hypothetical protein